MNGSSSNEADSSVIVKRSTDVRSVDHDDVVDNQDLRRESLGQHDEGQSRIYQVLASTSKVNGSGIGLKEHLEGNRNEEEFVVTSASSFGSIDQQSNQIRDHDPGSLQSQRLKQQKLSLTAANHAKTVNSIIEATGYSREEADSMTISSSMRLLNDLSGLISGQDTVSHEQSEERPRLTTRTGQGHHGKDIHYQDGDEVDQLLEDAPEDKSQEVVEDDSWSEDEIPEEDIPITKEERVGGQLEVGQAHGEARTVLQHEFDETPDEEESRTDDEDRVLEVIEVGQHQPAKRLRTENVTMEVTPVVSQAPTSELQMHLSQPTVKAVQLDEIQHNVRQDSRIYRQHNPAEQTYYQPQGSSYPAGYMYNSYSFTGNSQAPGYPVESREQMRDDFMTGHSASVNNHPPNMTMRSYQDYVETISPPPNKINKYSRMYHEEKMSYMLSSHGSSLYYGNHVDQPLDVGNTMISPREQLARQLDVRQQDTPPSSLRKPPRLILPQTARPPRSSNSRKPNVKKKQLVCPNQEAPGTAMKRRSPHSVSACSSPIEGNCFHFPPPLFPPWSPFYVTGPPNNNSPVTVSNPPFVMWTPMYGNKPSSLPNNIPVNEHTCMCIECVDTRLRNDVLAKKAEGQVYGTHTAMSVAQRTNVNSKNCSPEDNMLNKEVSSIDDKKEVILPNPGMMPNTSKDAIVAEWLLRSSNSPSCACPDMIQSPPSMKRTLEGKSRSPGSSNQSSPLIGQGSGQMIPFLQCPNGCGCIPMYSPPPCCLPNNSSTAGRTLVFPTSSARDSNNNSPKTGNITSVRKQASVTASSSTSHEKTKP